MRIILEAGPDAKLQLRAAENAIRFGIKEGAICSVSIGYDYFAVKRNKDSFRVYRQPQTSEASKA